MYKTDPGRKLERLNLSSPYFILVHWGFIVFNHKKSSKRPAHHFKFPRYGHLKDNISGKPFPLLTWADSKLNHACPSRIHLAIDRKILEIYCWFCDRAALWFVACGFHWMIYWKGSLLEVCMTAAQWRLPPFQQLGPHQIKKHFDHELQSPNFCMME